MSAWTMFHYKVTDNIKNQLPCEPVPAWILGLNSIKDLPCEHQNCWCNPQVLQ
jgi:hypothetical protein